MHSLSSTNHREQALLMGIKNQAGSDNDRCFECGETLFEKFSVSINLGIFLCMRHGTRHSGFGRRISQVKESDCGSWISENLLFMEVGGNARLRGYLQRRNKLDGKFNKQFYAGDELDQYRERIERKVQRKLKKDQKEERQYETFEEEKLNTEEANSDTDGEQKIDQQEAEIIIVNQSDSPALDRSIYPERQGNIEQTAVKRSGDDFEASCVSDHVVEELSQGFDALTITENAERQQNKEQKVQAQSDEGKAIASKIVNSRSQQGYVNFTGSGGSFQSSTSSDSSTSSNSAASSSSLFSSIFSSSASSKKQQVEPKQQSSTFGSLFSKAREKISLAKESLGQTTKQLMTEVQQKVVAVHQNVTEKIHDPDTHIQMQIWREELRVKASEASKIVDTSTTHIKDYAATAFISAKEKLSQKIKEAHIDKNYKELKTVCRHKYIDIQISSENFAHRSIKQIQSYLQNEEVHPSTGEIESSVTKDEHLCDQENSQWTKYQNTISSPQYIKEEAIDCEVDDEEEETKSDAFFNQVNNNYDSPETSFLFSSSLQPHSPSTKAKAKLSINPFEEEEDSVFGPLPPTSGINP